MLGEKIYRLRNKKGLTQMQLGDMVGVTNKAVSKWETNEANPDIGIIPKLAKVLGVSISELFDEQIENGINNANKVTRHGFVGVETRIDGRYEFVSDKRTKKGKPYLHINYGRGAKARGVMAIGNNAKGIFSVGLVSTGLFSVGLVSIGLFTVGLLALGLISTGVFALGLLSGTGAIAVGGTATGGIAIGVLATGGIAIGVGAVGGLAIGVWAYAGEYGRAIGNYIGRWWGR